MKICKHCSQEKPLTEFYKAKGYYNSWCKSCLREYHKSYYKPYYKKNKKTNHLIREKNNRSIPAGVYAIYENDNLIYIGESNKPYKRRAEHFSKVKKFNNSNIAFLIGKEVLKKEDLTFKMLEYIDDNNKRKKRERELIKQYKPKYNEN